MNMGGLTNARSLIGWIFTSEEHVRDHCQVGNLKPDLDVILDGAGEKSRARLDAPQPLIGFGAPLVYR